MCAIGIIFLALVAPIAGRYINGNVQKFNHRPYPTPIESIPAPTPLWTLTPRLPSLIEASESPIWNLNPPQVSTTTTSTTAINSSFSTSLSTLKIAADHSSLNSVNNPPTCYQPGGIAIGWSLPTDVDIKDIQARLAPSTTPCTYGTYVHITSTHNYGTAAMRAAYLAAANARAILSLSLQPFIPFKQVSAERIAKEMNALLAMKPQGRQGVIWLRFAHEMNWYIDTNKVHHGPTNYHGTAEELRTLWRDIATRVDRNRVKMFWSPNIQVPPDTLVDVGEKWWPGEEYVDIVGLDVYPQSTAVTFEFAFGEFYDMYAKPYDLPMQLAETGWLGGGTPAEKVYWWNEISKPETKQRCPKYIGFTWFEYNKEGQDFRVVDLVGKGDQMDEENEDEQDMGEESGERLVVDSHSMMR